MSDHLQNWVSAKNSLNRKRREAMMWIAVGLLILAGILVWSWFSHFRASSFSKLASGSHFSNSGPVESVENHMDPSPPYEQNSNPSVSADHTTNGIISRFLDKTRSISDRRTDAKRLALSKSPQALQALLMGFRQEEGETRRFIGRLMGNTRDPIFEKSLIQLLETGDDADASVAIHSLAAIGGKPNMKILDGIMKDDAWPDELRTEAALELLNTGNDTDAMSAISGLAVIGGDTCADHLTEIMRDTQRPENLRLEAALGLGVIGTPRAGNALATAFHLFPNPEIHAQLLDSLGRFPFPLIETTWGQYLDAPGTPDDLRSAAAEALAGSSPEALPFLQKLAATDRDPNVREMAAWAISAHGTDGALGSKLAEMARSEPEADVRRRLYEALLNQAQNPAESLLPVIREETDTAARVAAFNAVGDAVRRDKSSPLASEFDTQIVPELTQIALSQETLNIRMRAVFALRRAETPAAREALVEISVTPSKQIAQTAMNGLSRTTPTEMEGEEP